MEKKWRDENARIMQEHPAAVADWTPGTSLADPAAMTAGTYGDSLPTGTDETAADEPLAPSAADTDAAAGEEIGEQDARHAPPPPRQPGEELP
jgi:hypothetical protein